MERVSKMNSIVSNNYLNRHNSCSFYHVVKRCVSQIINFLGKSRRYSYCLNFTDLKKKKKSSENINDLAKISLRI